MLDGRAFRHHRSSAVRFARRCRVLPALCGAALLLTGLIQPAAAGIEDGVKAMQAGDMPAAEKALQLLAKERDPRAQFLLGFYVYGNPDSKLYDMNKATPLLLDAAERGYTPAMVPLAGAYADGKGVPKSYTEAYKWLAIAEHWNVPNADSLLIQMAHELKPDEIEHAKAAAASFTFKMK
jgi:TPR repeat protein